MSSVMRIC